MSRKKRVEKMYEGLSAAERAGIAIRWVKRGEEGDELLKSTMPDAQIEEYNGLVGLFLGLNVALMGRIEAGRLKAKDIGDRLDWLETAWMWGVAVFGLRCITEHPSFAEAELSPELGALVRDGLSMAPDMMVRALMGEGEVLEEVRCQENLSAGDTLMLTLLDGIVADLRDTAREARTLGFVAEGVRMRTGGEDPLWPKLRASLGASLEETEGLHKRVEGYVGELEESHLDGEECVAWSEMAEMLGRVFEGRRPGEGKS